MEDIMGTYINTLFLNYFFLIIYIEQNMCKNLLDF